MEVAAQLGKNTRRFRLEAGFSQEELAFRAGMKRSYLSDLERGTRNPSVRALGRLADALCVTPSQLLDST
jgi:transcriptional regulator with XRE-family HTH domain